MGGKSGTTKQTVSIPPEVLRRYNAVNTRAEEVAATPFQPYQGQFVAGLTPTQQTGIQATSYYSQAAQPYFDSATGQLLSAQQGALPGISAAYQNVGAAQDIGQQYSQAATGGIGGALQYAQPYQQAATGAALAGAEQLTPENINIQGYMNPYTQAVADTTYQALRQQQQQEMAGQTANAIKSGAFGGDRAGLVAANLARQQQLGTAQAMAPIYQQGYGQALGTAMTAAQSNRAALQNLAQQLQGIGQQGYGQQMGAAQQLAGLGQQQYGQGLGAAQQLAALAQQGYGMGAGTSQQLAALGTGAQQAGLQGAQAQLGAGTLEQQTQQADLTAQYQQFLQERGYPFQVAQFLANIAMGTGALSGSTTTTTQPMPFFSDRRVKHDVKEIGKTHDGQPIYSFKYNGEKATRIGLMAQDVEKKHPEAVYDIDGIKGVDYEEATKDSARPERYSGGLVPASMGGSVFEPGAYSRGGYAIGGDVIDPNDLQAILSQQQQAFGPFGEGGLYGGSPHDTPFGSAKGIVPQSRMHVPKLQTAGAPPPMPESGAQQVLSAYDSAMGMKKRYDEAKGLFSKKPTAQEEEDKSRRNLTTRDDVKNLAGPDIKAPASKEDEGILDYISSFFKADGGGVMPRSRYAIGGSSRDPSLPYEEDDKSPYKYFPTEILETDKAELPKPGQAPSPTSQTGIGAGDIASLAMKFILPFENGGSVPRRGYQQAGLVVGQDEEAGQTIEGGRPGQELPPVPLVRNVKKQDIFTPKETPDANFARSYSRTLQFEGSKPVVDNDGKLRRYGITPEEAGVSVDEITPSTAAPSYYKNYWLASGADKLPPNLAHVHFDTAVNSGVGRANQILKESGGDPARYLDLREQFLRNLAKNDTKGKYSPYLEGWMNRVNQLRGDISGELPSRGESAPVPAGGVVPEKVAASSKSSGIMPTASGIQNFLSENQNWLTPLGAGLKGMIQSRSPFLGAAILEGVGSGLEAVTPTQKALADIGQTRAMSAEALSTIPSRAIVRDKDGRVLGISVYVGGSLTPELVTIDEFFKAQKENRPYRVAPTIEGGAQQPSIQAPDLGVEPPPSVGGFEQATPESVAAAGQPQTQQQAAAAPIYRELPQNIKDIVRQNAETIRNTGTEGLNPSETNPFEAQSAAARASLRDLTGRNALTAAIASQPREGSMLSPNKFSAAVSQPIVEYVNGLLTNLNTGFTIADPKDLGNLDVIDKISRQLALQRTDEAGQRANAALVETLKAVPSRSTTPQGAAQLLADLYVMQQMDIDLDRFYRQSRDYAQQNYNLDQRQSQYIGQGLADEFMSNMAGQYAKEKQQIAALFNMPITTTNRKTGKKEKTYAITEIAKNNGIISDQLKSLLLEKGISPETFRYFSAQ